MSQALNTKILKNVVYVIMFLFIVGVFLVSSSFIKYERQRFYPAGDSCWARVKISCNSFQKRTLFENSYPIIPIDPNQLDSLGRFVQTKEIDSATTLTLKIYTTWKENPNTGTIRLEVLSVDSIINKYRWDCEYVGSGKGNCDTCQATNCEGILVGSKKICK